MIPTPLPTAKDVRELFVGMLGREVEAKVGTPWVDPAERPGAAVGVYVDPLTRISALVLFDLELTARAGAAIALVPPSGADLAIEEEMVPDALLENTAEILNVMSSLFNADDAPHLVLHAAYAPLEELPGNVTTWVRTFVRRLDMSLDIHGYGEGRLSVLVLD